MAGNQRRIMAEVESSMCGRCLHHDGPCNGFSRSDCPDGYARSISTPMTTITATVTRELERSFTPQELAEAGGVAAAKASVILECAKYGTVIDQSVDAKIA